MGKVKLADFCINEVGILPEVEKTAYMGPEGGLGHEADMFSLGVILYEMCTYVEFPEKQNEL